MSESKEQETGAAETAQQPTNSKGIPAAHFIENVDDFVGKHKGGAEDLLKEMHNLYGKYKFMENSLVTQKRQLLQKIPDIKSALQTLNFLIKKNEKQEECDVQFELSDALFAKAKVSNAKTVMLWLGANVMLEYSFAEAQEILTRNLSHAQQNLKSLDVDLSFLKDQITISEVNIARVHNYKVQHKQTAGAASTD